jgi:hypothetical protein
MVDDAVVPDGGNAKPRFRPTYKAGENKMTLEMLPDIGASRSIDMTFDELTAHITNLAEIRSAMAIEREIPKLEGISIKAVYDTRWYTNPVPAANGSAIVFYHPGYGPVGFIIPTGQAIYLASLLTAQAAASMNVVPTKTDEKMQ